MGELKRFGVSLDSDLLKQFDVLIKKKGYNNRSEAIRDLIRNDIVEEKWEDDTEESVGAITLIYDHHQHGLNSKLISKQHDSSADIKATLHVHLDHHYCMEVIVVGGEIKTIKKIADELIGLRGVKHGKLSATGWKDLT